MKKKIIVSALSLFLVFTVSVGAATAYNVLFKGKSISSSLSYIFDRDSAPFLTPKQAASVYGLKYSYDKKTNTYSLSTADYKAKKTVVSNETINHGPITFTVNKLVLDYGYAKDEYETPEKSIYIEATVQNTSAKTVRWDLDSMVFALSNHEMVADSNKSMIDLKTKRMYSLDNELTANKKASFAIVLNVPNLKDINGLSMFMPKVNEPVNYNDVQASAIYDVDFK
ncbi:MAG: hypothetical protein ACRCWQ_05275 [Bacilli bacterium]